MRYYHSQTGSALYAVPTPYPTCCLHDLVRLQAARTPARIAMRMGSAELSYSDLERRSNQLARCLRARGVCRGVLVALLLERTPEMVVALLAILKAGGAYLPLDPVFASTRLAETLSASEAQLVITRRQIQERLEFLHTSNALLLDDRAYEDLPGTEICSDTVPEETCYVIYTSGSTGSPKGVQVSHRSLVNVLWSLKSAPGIGEQDVVLATMSASFDASAHELLLPLVVGAQVELASAEEVADATRLRTRLEECGVTLLAGTPALWHLLIAAGWQGNRSMRLICGGEKLTAELAVELLQRAGSLWNVYGPTETTVTATAVQVHQPSDEIPLGGPVANSSLHVLDEAMRPVQPGVAGELYIAGDGVAIGYWRRPDLTAAKFVTIRGEGDHLLRAYRTGDRVRLNAQGAIEFLGRLDFQVKLRGFRIELSEIESVARRCPEVQDAVVVKHTDPARGEYLAAFVISQTERRVSIQILRALLQKQLPAYMVPAVIQVVSGFPVTVSGKVDRRQLAENAVSENRSLSIEEKPSGATEAALEEIWRKFLKMERVGRHDNFFEIGGDSLLAAQLSAAMSKRFRRRCLIGSLHQAPTIALYAAFLTGHGVESCVVLNPGSPAMQDCTLFWIDHPERIHTMAGFMGHQPVCSVLLSPDELAMHAPDYTMERLASRIMKHLISHQHTGCFCIGGFCQNALLAYEVAQQLSASGYKVPLLVMIDPVRPAGRDVSPSVGLRLRRRLENEKFHLSSIRRQRPSRWLSYFRRRWMNFQFLINAHRWQRHARSGGRSLPRAESLTEALFVSQLAYRPVPYEGPVLYIQPTMSPRGREAVALKGWQSLLLDHEVVKVTGDHMSLFAFPGAQALAGEVRRVLGRKHGSTEFGMTAQARDHWESTSCAAR